MIRLNGNPFEVVGVMPSNFTFLQNDTDVFLPAAFAPAAKADSQRTATTGNSSEGFAQAPPSIKSRSK